MFNKIIFFDLDGVLFDSIKNMELAWNKTNNEFNLNVPFKNYKKFIGKSFKQILINNNIRKNHKEIQKYYNDQSMQNIDFINPYAGILEVLNELRNHNYLYLGLYTSKSKKRAEYLLKKFDIKFQSNFFGDGKYQKPDPTPILDLEIRLNINKKDIYFIGDSLTDYELSENCGINFCLANWGYEKINCEINLKKTKDILKLL